MNRYILVGDSLCFASSLYREWSSESKEKAAADAGRATMKSTISRSTSMMTRMLSFLVTPQKMPTEFYVKDLKLPSIKYGSHYASE